MIVALLVCFAAILFLGGQYPGVSLPRAHQSWLLIVCLVVVATVFPPWIMLGLLVVAAHAWWVCEQDKFHGESEHLYKLLAALAGIVAVSMTITEPIWLLRGIACLSVPLAAWTAYSQSRYPLAYSRFVGPVLVYERTPSHIAAGQMNVNYTEAVSATLGAVAVGLMLESWWWGLLVPCAVSPILMGRWNRRHHGHGLRASQGDVYLLALGLLAVHPWAVLALLPVAAFAYRREASTRTTVWWSVLRDLWWPSGLGCKLVGRGIHGWSRDYLVYMQNQPLHPTRQVHDHWTHAHNEYLQTMYEYGVIGVVCLLGGLATLLQHSTHPSVWNMGVILCLVACAQSPWTFYHEFLLEQVDPSKNMVYKFRHGHGNLALLMLSGLWMALALAGYHSRG